MRLLCASEKAYRTAGEQELVLPQNPSPPPPPPIFGTPLFGLGLCFTVQGAGEQEETGRERGEGEGEEEGR